MQTTASTPANHQRAVLIRLSGLSILASFAIHIMVNFTLKEFPPLNPSLDELKAYLDAEADAWAMVHGLRNLAVVGMIIFLAGLHARIAGGSPSSSSGWEMVGLVGGVLHVSSLFLTNGLETFAFLDFEQMSEKSELFWLVFHMTRVLFTAEVAAWSVMLFGFSIAGWQTGRLPKLISTLGFVSALACILSGLFIGSVLSGGWADKIIQVAELSALAWFICVGAFMAARGDS